ncbi:MAG: hypothetical protein Q9218_003231 [Villophora microphyllina]
MEDVDRSRQPIFEVLDSKKSKEDLNRARYTTREEDYMSALVGGTFVADREPERRPYRYVYPSTPAGNNAI